jgi:hypothetical protein
MFVRFAISILFPSSLFIKGNVLIYCAIQECRYVPRVRDTPGWRSRRKPHCDPAYQSHTVICYCAACDEKVERDLPLCLFEYCVCDQYTRWICLPCRVKEDQLDGYYYKVRTKGEWEWNGDQEEGMWLWDHQSNRAVSEMVPFAHICGGDTRDFQF